MPVPAPSFLPPLQFQSIAAWLLRWLVWTTLVIIIHFWLLIQCLESFNNRQILTTVTQAANQLNLSATPYLLTNDRINLGILTDQFLKHSPVLGLLITDTHNAPLISSGSVFHEGLQVHEEPLQSGNIPLGTLRVFWSSRLPPISPGNQPFFFLGFALVDIAFLLAICLSLARYRLIANTTLNAWQQPSAAQTEQEQSILHWHGQANTSLWTDTFRPQIELIISNYGGTLHTTPEHPATFSAVFEQISALEQQNAALNAAALLLEFNEQCNTDYPLPPIGLVHGPAARHSELQQRAIRLAQLAPPGFALLDTTGVLPEVLRRCHILQQVRINLDATAPARIIRFKHLQPEFQQLLQHQARQVLAPTTCS